MTNQLKVAFIGLGVMGYPMAGFLVRAGYQICVYNRTRSKARQCVFDYGGTLAETPAEAASDADFVFCCVGDDNDLRQVTIGEAGAFSTMKAGSVFVDHTTTSAEVAKELHGLAKEREIGFIDAPVSGGQIGAEKGQLTIMCGGDQPVFDRAAALMACYGQRVKLMGASGSGQLTKMVNQICIAGVLQGLAEGLHFARQAGLDGAAVVDVISRGAAQSWQMENRYQSMLDGHYDYGFAVDWMRKDLAICLKEAEQTSTALPLTALVDQFYKDIQNMGGGRWDTSSLLARLDAIAAI